jgi:hypothetical protein
MQKEFVSYEIALALKELGFDERCFAYYLSSLGIYLEITSDFIDLSYDSSNCIAPTYSQAFRWFREKGLNYTINPYYSDTTDTVKYELMVYHIGGSSPMGRPIMFKTYEEAELECLVKLIEIVKQKK